MARSRSSNVPLVSASKVDIPSSAAADTGSATRSRLPSGSVSDTSRAHGWTSTTDAEFDGDRVDVVDPDVDEPVRIRVAGVFGQVDLGIVAPDPDVGGEMRFESVFEDLREAEPPVPGNSTRRVGHSQDRHDIGGHGRISTGRSPSRIRRVWSTPSPRATVAYARPVAVLVLVNGPPASGKSTIADALVAADRWRSTSTST